MFPSCDEKREFFFKGKDASLIGNDRNTCIYLYTNCNEVYLFFKDRAKFNLIGKNV